MKLLGFNSKLKSPMLRPRYHLRMTGLGLLCFFLGIGVWGYFGIGLAELLKLDMDSNRPIQEEPHGLLWMLLWFLSLGVSFLLSSLLNYLFMAITLRWSYDWTWLKIRELILESRIPSHWMKAPSAQKPRKFFPFYASLSSELILPRYHLRIMGLNLLCILLGFGVGSCLSIWMGHLLNLNLAKATMSDPHALLWFCLSGLGILLSVVLCQLLSFLLLAITLHYFYGWTGPRIRELIFASRIPAHWLNATGQPPRSLRFVPFTIYLLLGVGLIVVGLFFSHNNIMNQRENGANVAVGGVAIIGLAFLMLFAKPKPQPK